MDVLAIEPSGLHPSSHTRDLAERLQSIQPEGRVRYAYFPETGGGGPDLVEFVGIWLPKVWGAIDEPLLSAIMGQVVVWAWKRLAKLSAENPESEARPQLVSLYGPDGKVLKQYKISTPGVEPEDLTLEARDVAPRTRPPLQTKPPD